MDDAWNAGITWLDEPLAGAPAGALAGRTLLVKDLVDTAGIRTTYGSRIYAAHVPDTHAPVVQRSLDAGAVVVGKGNLPEFAWSVLGQSPWYGDVHNPRHPGRTTCGSSSGNGAALAAGLVDLAIGTDTGGSIRLPAAACDVVGLKPEWGRIPADRVFPLCPTLDTVGPMATTVEDTALLWSVLAAAPVPAPRLEGLTVGRLRRAPALADGRDPAASDMAEAGGAGLERLGARVVEATIPDAPGDMWPLFDHEALQSHAATYPSRADEYGPVMQKKLAGAASRVTPEKVAAAYDALHAWRAFQPDVDLYVSPCIGVELPAENAFEPDVRLPVSSFVRWVNLLGWSALAIGNLQLVAPADETVLAAGLAWERG